ncbi:endonuclease/exonuclease/phosphatase family protein [Rhodococcus sp. NPDC058521]|uniref:endonuclease/exonuclease/phosphatase family protein n=1 Tax=Rhodococcus sp. NPDC058521 TaxID=3346536 RepID=UPI0036640266
MQVARADVIRRIAVAGLLAFSAAGCSNDGGSGTDSSDPFRFATFNASLNRSEPGRLIDDLSTGDNAQAKTIAEIVQINQPDVLLVNEFDFDAQNRAADLFRENYLKVGRNGRDGIDYPYAFTAPVNTGEPSGRDLDNDGKSDGPGDAHGFGNFPGQYGMLVLSKHPIDTDSIRTFRHFLWKDMPNSLLPRDYYGDNAESLRLSSKSHWDVPIDVNGETVHLLASHPTPPSFDGPEDRNGKRNHDEVRMSADYIAGGGRAGYLYDDAGARGGLEDGARFVMAGDQNSDPADGGSVPDTIAQVLELPRVQDPSPKSTGAVESARSQGGPNHTTPPELDTADFGEPDPGNLRVDYVLPSENLEVTDSTVFWPAEGEEGADLMSPQTSSDHRLVWTDIRIG